MAELDLAAADLLEKAAGLLESGSLTWIQGRVGGVDTRTACAVGALRYANHGDVLPIWTENESYSHALAALATELNTTVSFWNDNLSKSHGRSAVIRRFRKVAKKLRRARDRRP